MLEALFLVSGKHCKLTFLALHGIVENNADVNKKHLYVLYKVPCPRWVRVAC
jgi:hypothetical protein